jgi:glucosamine--fructose-6-phosphate aminotransferase (isomerizing)
MWEDMKPIMVLAQQIDFVEEYIASEWLKALSCAQDLTPARKKVSQVLLGGCGDSHHAAMGLELAFNLYSHKQVCAMEAMRLARYAPSVLGNQPEFTLVVGISCSGEVARTVEALEIWRELGAQTLAITMNSEATLVKVANRSLILTPPSVPHDPGLLSYIGSLLMGYAAVAWLSGQDEQRRLGQLINEVPELLHEWVRTEKRRAEAFAEIVEDGIAVFVGSGPAHGSAKFGAAKVIEAAGERCWAQDLEEWAHLEYFCDPAYMPTIVLSAEGRSGTRESEILEAMKALGRFVHLSRWSGGEGWSAREREALSPLALWVAPSAYASRRAELLSEQPFRNFRGGRDPREGGGASRIRSSKRIRSSDLGLT